MNETVVVCACNKCVFVELSIYLCIFFSLKEIHKY